MQMPTGTFPEGRFALATTMTFRNYRLGSSGVIALILEGALATISGHNIFEGRNVALRRFESRPGACRVHTWLIHFPDIMAVFCICYIFFHILVNLPSTVGSSFLSFQKMSCLSLRWILPVPSYGEAASVFVLNLQPYPDFCRHSAADR